MTFSTLHFGQIAVEPGAVIEFPEGLPGFADRRRFAPLTHPAVAGVIFLQSLECPALCFLTVPVQTLRRDYSLDIAAEDLDLLGFPAGCRPAMGKEVNVLAILSLVEGEAPTANLRSPVVIRVATGRAVQAIRPDERYGCREPLVQEGEPVCW